MNIQAVQILNEPLIHALLNGCFCGRANLLCIIFMLCHWALSIEYWTPNTLNTVHCITIIYMFKSMDVDVSRKQYQTTTTQQSLAIVRYCHCFVNQLNVKVSVHGAYTFLCDLWHFLSFCVSRGDKPFHLVWFISMNKWKSTWI